jgi:phage-related protein
VKDAFSDAWNDVSGWLSGLWGRITSAVGDIATNFYNWGHTAFERVKDAFGDAWTDVSGWLGKVGANVVSAVGNIGDKLYDAGKAIITGFLNGIKAAWNDVTGFVGKMGSWISDHKGPLSYDSTLLTPHGNAIMQGLADGLQQGFASKVVPMVSGIAGKIASQAFGASANIGISSSGLAAIPNLSALNTAGGGGSSPGGGGNVVYLTSSPTFTLQGTPESMLKQMQDLIDSGNQDLVRQLEAAR